MAKLGLQWSCLVVVLACLSGAPLTACKATQRVAQKVAARVRGKEQVAVGEAPATGSLLAARWSFHAAVFTTAPPQKDVNALGRRLSGEGFSVVEEDAADNAPGATVVIASPAIKDYEPPELSDLEYRAKPLSDEQRRALHDCRAVTVLNFAGPSAQTTQQYRAALELIEALAVELGGFPWDGDARRAYTPESWKELLEHWQGNLPHVAKHVSLDLYRDGELFRVVSLGMSKFALPDVTVNQVGSADGLSMASLTNLVLQTLLEQGKLGVGGRLAASIDALRHDEARLDLQDALWSNAKKSIDVSLAVATRQEGDADNRLLELVFPGAIASLQERQSAALRTLFGSEDAVTSTEHDQELLDVSHRARATALAIGKRYANGPPFGEELQVKAPFDTTHGGREWMWVEVVTWKGDDIRGILRNDPVDVPSLKNGARVEVEAGKIFDYLLIKRDGTSEGNQTGEIIEAREKHGAEVPRK